MRETDCSQQKLQELRRKPRPTSSQNEVVGILNVQARDTMKYVKRSEQFLNVQKTDVPWPVLHLESGLQSIGCTAVSATAVVENDGQFAQASPEEALLSQAASAANVFVLRIFG